MPYTHRALIFAMEVIIGTHRHCPFCTTMAHLTAWNPNGVLGEGVTELMFGWVLKVTPLGASVKSLWRSYTHVFLCPFCQEPTSTQGVSSNFQTKEKFQNLSLSFCMVTWLKYWYDKPREDVTVNNLVAHSQIQVKFFARGTRKYWNTRFWDSPLEWQFLHSFINRV